MRFVAAVCIYNRRISEGRTHVDLYEEEIEMVRCRRRHGIGVTAMLREGRCAGARVYRAVLFRVLPPAQPVNGVAETPSDRSEFAVSAMPTVLAFTLR